MTSGAQERHVDEPLAILTVELSVIAEPKALLPSELKKLVAQHGGYRQVANAVGVSEAFIRQNVNIRKSKKS